ncbi:hypothetical protein [Paenibacillus sp. NPDC058071]|uniref:hypothetical protein n=1 Tax=Paenibacillus sp. NPDC058071 TaxID=3346326 RepID=UPI0036DB324E
MNVVKLITVENYYKPCEAASLFAKYEDGQMKSLTESDYINAVELLNVNQSAPNEVKELFETSRALYVYGYLYWTFFTVALEQAMKSWELAITIKLSELQEINKRIQLAKKIDLLKHHGIILEEDAKHFHMTRLVRNHMVHPSSQSQLGHNIGFLQVLAEQINILYK